MRHLIQYILAASILARAALAQEPKESVPPTTPSPQTDPSRVVYELDVSPADEPRPAMKYRLLPNPADLKPGNAATQYYKAFALSDEAPIRGKAYEVLEGWTDMPLRDINIDELGKTLQQVNNKVFYRSIRAATYRSHCDWEEPIEEEGVYLPVPAIQEFRSVARLLAMKAKYEIARGQYEEAMATGRDVFTLAYHLQRDGEMIVQNLVGIAMIGSILHDAFFVEWIRSPNSPNLYWALAEIPPYFDTRRTIAGDLRVPEYTLPWLKDIGLRRLTSDEALAIAVGAFSIEADATLRRQEADWQQRAVVTAWALQAYEESYRELRDSGISQELLEGMPVLQVALLGRWKRYQIVRDDLYKWAAVAYGPDRELSLRKLADIYQQSRTTTVPFNVFLPPLRPMYRAQLRQFRFLSGLRAIEALRIYAARHGDFPKALADIRDVPVPDDPVTNAPFVYRGGGRTAVLTMVRHNLGADIEYEYQLRLRDTPVDE